MSMDPSPWLCPSSFEASGSPLYKSRYDTETDEKACYQLDNYNSHNETDKE